jgi:hypothetical protein
MSVWDRQDFGLDVDGGAGRESSACGSQSASILSSFAHGPGSAPSTSQELERSQNQERERERARAAGNIFTRLAGPRRARAMKRGEPQSGFERAQTPRSASTPPATGISLPVRRGIFSQDLRDRAGEGDGER